MKGGDAYVPGWNSEFYVALPQSGAISVEVTEPTRF